MSKPMATTQSKVLEDGKSEDDPEVVRQRLSQRVIELREAVVVGPRKIKLKWEVGFI